ncbi:TIGR04028 family ABC transporter substrate-binding protein [Georgenia sp. TF02-10]|uniref:TIGR04028 family ABC transporter substrate-binding protein n=1 Tax=Georgenia sp. TF02-10 TaxID=2917725 RepID=UPI001FA6AB9A|nr:TIGR04028 family ABC transporter substrate-binding protein [Georgenia sp. TF02-10]UNX53815.1 TIGR04028 family ABC transporter substrate-binding protein [Georgenia sp. TF02-10]
MTRTPGHPLPADGSPAATDRQGGRTRAARTPARTPARTTAAVAVLGATALLAGCAGGRDAAASGGQPDGQGGNLTYLEYQPHTTLYPPQSGFYPNGALVNNVTDRLTYQDPETLEIEPWIATDWQVNADATEYTFNLRDGVTFSDGTPLDAAAVARNFDTFGLGDDERGLTVSEAVNNYAGSEVVDEDTVTFRFSAPAPGFLQATSTITSGLLSPETLDRPLEDLGAGSATEIVGSGPFVITDEQVGTEITLTAREDYDWAPPSSEHQGRAHLDTVTIVVTPEDSVRLGSLLSGQADVVRYVQAPDEEQVTQAGFQLFAPQTRGVNNGLALRFTNPLLADLRVRQALVHGVDNRQVVETVFTDNYPAATSVLSAAAPGYHDTSEALAHDPDRAAALLTEAGWTPGPDGIRVKDGQRLSLDVYASAAQPLSKPTLELVGQQLAEIGVELNVKSPDAGSYATDTLDPLKTPLYHSMVGRADLDVIKSQFHTDNRDVLLSDDATLDGLLEAVAAEPDPQARLQRSADVQDYLAEQAYYIPLFEEPQVYGAAPDVTGLAFEAVGRPTFYDVATGR